MNIFARENDYRGIRVEGIKKKKNPRMDPDALQQTTAWPMAVHPESTESTGSMQVGIA